MYKLFLCLRYLVRKVMAYFAMGSVALCVAMMLIVVSVMNGFLDRIEQAAKGLFGDVIVESVSLSGLARYDEFIGEMKSKVPEVQEASPFIITYGILRVPLTDYRQTVQVAGIRLPERADVTDFAKGLFVQAGDKAPTFDPPKDLVLRKVREDAAFLERMIDGKVPTGGTVQPRQLYNALSFHDMAEENIEQAGRTEKDIAELEARLEELRKSGAPAEDVRELTRRISGLNLRRFLPPKDRVILGVGIPGLSVRTPRGDTIRYMVPGSQIALMLVPLGKGSLTDITPTHKTLSVIDDCRTDVSSIDSNIVYVPLETLQSLNEMGEETFADGTKSPARVSAIHIKTRDGLHGERELLAVREKVEDLWEQFRTRYPDAAGTEVTVKTWRERQAPIISNIAAQRVLVIIMFALISTVAIVLIFVLFYTIVVQKTRDIGVLKAVGASSLGVADIFLAYGAAVGLVGSAVGTLLGYVFVRNINPIHDWVGRTFGLVVWSREYFMFDKIPNEVHVVPAAAIALAAVLAGVLGALLPATVAARMQPVEALRYE